MGVRGQWGSCEETVGGERRLWEGVREQRGRGYRRRLARKEVSKGRGGIGQSFGDQIIV